MPLTGLGAGGTVNQAIATTPATSSSVSYYQQLAKQKT
jgi:hypothetical protein